MLNIQLVDGDCCWNKRHGKGEFKGKRIPFGCAIDFLPNKTKTKWRTRNKWSSTSVPGIFMGYKLLPGHTWSFEYYVAAIEDLFDLDLSSDAKGLDARLSIHTVREIVVDNLKGYIFPLKAKYDAKNRSVDGIPLVMEDATVIFGWPPPVPLEDELADASDHARRSQSQKPPWENNTRVGNT